MAMTLDGIETVTLFVEDLRAAKDFYGRALGLPLLFEDPQSAVFRMGATMINALVAQAAPELIEPAFVGAPGAGSRFLMTIRVDDIDASCADLAGRGVTFLNGPIDRPWGRRTAAFQDPAGHSWELAAEI
jgi:catechol 2,3-dioxygenase-like lactoylglutathione lyase family enzyme